MQTLKPFIHFKPFEVRQQRRRDTPFTPAALFAASEPGVWLDPLDPATVFSDTAGTTQAQIGDPVALVLDKSKGLELGPELADGILDSTTNWTFLNDVTVTGGAIVFNDAPSTSGMALYNPIVSVGKRYEITFTVSGSGLVNFRVGSGGDVINSLSAGSYTLRGLAAGGTPTSIVFNGTASAVSNFVGSINNISVRELPGNHLLQTSATFRPTLNDGVILFDGGDDRLVSPYVSGTSGSLFARFNGATASRVLLGAQPATDGRAFLGLDASGRIAAGIGEQATGVIFAGPDLRDAWHIGGVTWDGTTVKLYLDGAEVYSEPQVGAVSGATPAMLGALNANGTAAAFWDGRISNALAVDRPLTPAEITNLTNEWSA